MITNLYCIYDLKAQTIVSIFVSLNDETAERSFFDLLSTPNETVFTMHPGDFSLKKITSIDKDFKFLEAPKDLIFGSSYSSALLKNRAKERLEHQLSLQSMLGKKPEDGNLFADIRMLDPQEAVADSLDKSEV